MDLTERIARRQAAGTGDRLVTDLVTLSPAHHLADPVDRGPDLERLLDALAPVFDGGLPLDLAVTGPKGSGKSALVSALFAHLDEHVGSSTAIGTTTRAGTGGGGPSEFVYVDARRATSEFGFYHTLLDAVSDEPVPERGLSTSALEARLRERFESPGETAVVAVDHVDERGSLSCAEASELLAPVRDDVSLTVVADGEPDGWDGQHVSLDRYRLPTLVDVLTERASRGLARGALTHQEARQIAVWADGDAHDALAALFGAASLAAADGTDRIREDDIDAAVAAVPDDCIDVGRVLALPENRQRVLVALLAVDPQGALTVKEAAAAVAERLDLTESTVTRFLYELAEDGILARERVAETDGDGRHPSRVRPRFPTLAFERLYGVDHEGV